MLKLEPIDKSVLDLCIAGLTNEDISTRLNETLNNVKKCRLKLNRVFGGSNLESMAAGAARKKVASKPEGSRTPTITPFSYKVIEELAKGTGVTHIHNRLSMESSRELDQLLDKLFRQFNVKTRAELVVVAIYEGYIK